MNAMNDTAIILPAAATQIAKAPAKRGRKPETRDQRVERMERALAEAKAKAKEARRDMWAVVGEAMLAEAESDSAFMARVVAILRQRVTSATAKADIAPLLAKHPLPGAAG
jgi:hypothetical protein